MADKAIAYLRIISGPQKGRVFVLKELSVFDVGRGEGSQIRLEGDRIGTNHARIYRKDDSWIFFDLNSDTGSSINDIRVMKRQLDGGEIIRLGGIELQFTFEPPQKKSTKSAEPTQDTAATTPEAPVGLPNVPPPAQAPKASALPPDSATMPQESPTSQLRSFALKESSAPKEPERTGLLRLTVIDGDKRDIGKEILFDAARECLIGRSANCALILADTKVSRLHCRIEHSNGQSVITDLNSANGTVLNGERVNQSVLKPGDYLRLGFTVLAYEKVLQVARVNA